MFEVSQYKSCPREALTQGYYDPRYYTTNAFQTTEYAVQTESRVLNKLRDETSGYNKAQNVPDPTVKQQMGLTAWTRPTIPWSLTCENELGLSR